MAEDKKQTEDAIKAGTPTGVRKRKRVSKSKRYAQDIFEAVAIALVLALIIRTFLFQAFKIPSSSMEDTLLIGDHILVSKSSYGFQLPKPAMIEVFGITVPFFETELKTVWGEIERGDIVVFRFPEDRSKDFIKRVIALEGDRVEVKDKKVYVNGEPTEEPYALFKGSIPVDLRSNSFGPYVVPRSKIFVMGDNRDRSFDSRFWGAVDMKDIKGRAFIVYWSRDPARGWPLGIRLGRFAQKIR